MYLSFSYVIVYTDIFPCINKDDDDVDDDDDRFFGGLAF